MTQNNLTPEQLAEAVARIAELDKKRAAGNWYAHNDNQAINACVVNDHKEGWDRVESDYTLVDADECPNLEPDDIAFIAAAPLMARIIRQLSAECEQRENDLRKALYPNGVKHPQQGEWVWLVEEASAMQKRLDELEAHHCEAPRNKRIRELEKECAALAAHQCHKPYGDEYGNMRCEYQKIIEQHRAAMVQAREASKDLVRAAKTLTKALDRQYKNKPPPCFSSPYEENEWLKAALAQLDAALGGV